jgi:PAS domain S-box-containing protein
LKKSIIYSKALNDVFAQAPVNISIVKANDYIIEFANEYYLSLFDKKEDIVGKSLFEVSPELVKQGIKSIIDQVIKTGIPYIGKKHSFSIKNDNFLVKSYSKFIFMPIEDSNGSISKIIFIPIDITEQIKNQLRGEEAERLYHELIYSSPSMMAVLKGKSMIISIANASMIETWGKGKDVIGKSLFEVMPEIVEQGFDKILLKVFKTGAPYFSYEQPINIMRYGKMETIYYTFVYHAQRNAKGEIEGIAVIANEVNAQALLHQKIQENEYSYEQMIYSSTTAIGIVKGRDFVIYTANDAILEILGKGKNIIGKPYFAVMPELIEQGYQEVYQNVYDTGKTFIATETAVDIIQNGKMERKYYNFILQAQRNRVGEIDSIGIIAHEVTSQAIINKRIKESESYFRMIAELIPEKVTNATPDGTVIFYNKSWTEYTGASFDELKNDGWSKWIHPDDVQKTHTNWNYSVKTGSDFDMELRMLNHLGEYRWHISRARAIKDETGNIKLWIGTNGDIHNQKQQTHELEKAVAKRTAELQHKNREITETKEKLLSEYSRSLIEASHDPLFVISPKGKITDINQAAIKVVGIIRQKLIGTNFYDYFTDPQKAREVYQEVFLKGFVADYPLTIKDKILTDVLFNGSVYKDGKGNVLGAVVVARDITELKKVEKQLLESKIIAEQEKENAVNAQKIAESAVKSKQQFLSNMSHEIRTPMNAIIGFTKVMKKTELSLKQKEYLNAIELSGDALIVLINDILDLAKVESGQMTFEKIPFKLASSITTTIRLFEPKINEKNIQLIEEYDKRIPENLLGDPARLNQILLNLLSNAVKFTRQGNITISVRLMEEDDEKVTVEFAIKVTGIGIKKENLDTIFENFQQATNETSRLFGGTGLGLAIVKQLLEPQGGKILVESEINVGSKFSFTLTFLKTETTLPLIPETIQLDLAVKGIKVLVVEDMALNQLLIKTILDDFGFDAEIANNGKIAIEKLKNNHYDIILMDLQMPEMNGFEATDYIRNTMKSSIPIMALTADVTTVDVEKCKEAGMNDYIAKPIDETLLYSKIITLIKNAVKTSTEKIIQEIAIEKVRCINLESLQDRTKSNPKYLKEIISIYLEQTPPLIKLMKTSFDTQNWETLSATAHKMIPSFSIIGMNRNFEEMARKIQDFANNHSPTKGISSMITQLEAICGQACIELKDELKKLT